MEMTQTYRTSDIYIASYLLSKGLELQGIDRHNSKRYDFIFIDREDRPNHTHKAIHISLGDYNALLEAKLAYQNSIRALRLNGAVGSLLYMARKRHWGSRRHRG